MQAESSPIKIIQFQRFSSFLHHRLLEMFSISSMMPSQALKSVCQPMRRDEALASQPHIWMNALEKKIMIYNQI